MEDESEFSNSISPSLFEKYKKMKNDLLKIMNILDFNTVKLSSKLDGDSDNVNNLNNLNLNSTISVMHLIEIILYNLSNFKHCSAIETIIQSLRVSDENYEKKLDVLICDVNSFLRLMNFPYMISKNLREYDYVYLIYFFILEFNFLEDLNSNINEYFKSEVKIKPETLIDYYYDLMESKIKDISIENLTINESYSKYEKATKELISNFKDMIKLTVSLKNNIEDLKNQSKKKESTNKITLITDIYEDIIKTCPLYEIIVFSNQNENFQEKILLEMDKYKEESIKNYKKLNLICQIINNNHNLIVRFILKLRKR